MLLNSQPIKISGVGRYVPERRVPNREVEALCGLPEGWAERKNGVKQRFWADPRRETNAYMGAAASLEAIKKANLKPEEIDLILNASGTFEQILPDGAALLQRGLGLEGSGIPCMSVHTTCLSFISALQMALGLFATQGYRHILISSSEIASVGLNFQESESATLMGDGAAAIVLSRASAGEASRFEATAFETYAAGADLTEIRGGGSKIHPYAADAKPEDLTFHMRGPAVLRMARRHIRGFLDRLKPGLSEGLEDVDFVIPHQASLVGLKLMRYFNWPESKIAMTIEKFGNTIAASIPMALYEMVESGHVQRGDRLLLVGTGAGLSLGGVILVY